MFIRKFILTALLIVAGTYAFGQNFKAGLWAGFSATQVDGDNYSGYNKFGFIGGGFVNYSLRPNKKLEMQILFMQKGARVTPNEDKGTYTDYFLNANYIEFPLLYLYDWKKFTFKVGLMPDIYIGRTEESNGDDLTDNPYYDMRPVSLSFYGGLSYNITEHIAISAIYTYSLLSIRKNTLPGNVYFLFEHGAYSNAMSFGLNYTF